VRFAWARERAILRGQALHRFDWDQAIRYADG
jgi:hypothetical protein